MFGAHSARIGLGTETATGPSGGRETGSPHLSVVIPCLNVAGTLAAQLEALADQPVPWPWELVIADNGSTDDTLDVVDKFRHWFPRLVVVDASRRTGAPHALNMGIHAASADLLCLLDGDDVAGPGYLAAMSKALSEHRFVAAHYDCETLNSEATLNARGRPQRDGLMDLYKFLPYAGAGGFGFHRDVFDRLGGFEPRLRACFDIDFCWRAQLAGVELVFAPDVVVQIRFRQVGTETFRQSRFWGRYEAALNKRFPGSLTPAPLGEVAKGWLRIPLKAHRVKDETYTSRYLREAGMRVGRLEGSIRERTLFL